MTTRWLDEREERAWRGFHRMRTDLLGHLGRQLTNRCNLSEAEFVVLVAVSEAPDGQIRSRELCRELGWERSRLSHQIARMERRGTIAREPCGEDARGFDVVLTPAGLIAIQTAAPINLEAVRHCFADILTSSQLDALGEITDVIVNHIAEAHPSNN